MSYSTAPLADLLDRFSTSEPVPGGGPAAAIAAALGTSLVTMAANLVMARCRTGEDAGELASTIERLRSRQAELLALADRDSVAYAAVRAAYRLPKDTPAEQDARAAAIQVAMQAATEMPLGMMRSSEQVLCDAVTVAARVPASAHVDLTIGIALIEASLSGCAICVNANADVLSTTGHRRRFILESARIVAAATAHLDELGALARSRTPPNEPPQFR